MYDSKLTIAQDLLQQWVTAHPADAAPVTFDNWFTQPAFCNCLDQTLHLPYVGTLADSDKVTLKTGPKTLREFADQLKADAVLVNKLKSLPNVDIHTSAQTTEITGDGQKVDGLRYKDRVTGQEHAVELAGVFVQIGLVPNTEWLKGTVELSRHGEILVDEHGATSVPGIYAAGNVVHVYDLVDWVSEAGRQAGSSAARFATMVRRSEQTHVPVRPGDNVRYIVPQTIDRDSLAEGSVRLQLRVRQPIESPVWVEVRNNQHLVSRKGELYARPGEIITLEIPMKAYDEVQWADELTIAIVKR